MFVPAAARRLPRQGPVNLWGACNYPSQGIIGPLPCEVGSECICKDNSTLNAVILVIHAIFIDWGLPAYSQCRQEVDGSWAGDPSWQCHQPGDTSKSTLPPIGTIPSQPSSAGTVPDPAAGSVQPVVAAAPSSSLAAVPQPSVTANGRTDLATTSSQGSSSNGRGSRPATQGNCDSTGSPSGWDGVASTSVGLRCPSFKSSGELLLRWCTVLWLDGVRLSMWREIMAMVRW